MIKSYRDLIVWQKSMELVEFVYQIIKNLPDNEEYGLSIQIRKCVVSIPSNIAEGYGRKYTADYKRFLQIARGSLYELQTQLEIAVRLKFIDNQYIKTIESHLKEIEKMFNTLINKIKNTN